VSGAQVPYTARIQAIWLSQGNCLDDPSRCSRNVLLEPFIRQRLSQVDGSSACRLYLEIAVRQWAPVSTHSVFCSVLQPSSIRGLATPWTYFLHLSLSSVILTDSSTESSVHVLMLSVQAVRGLPRLRAPAIVPCIISSRNSLVLFWP